MPVRTCLPLFALKFDTPCSPQHAETVLHFRISLLGTRTFLSMPSNVATFSIRTFQSMKVRAPFLILPVSPVVLRPSPACAAGSGRSLSPFVPQLPGTRFPEFHRPRLVSHIDLACRSRYSVPRVFAGTGGRFTSGPHCSRGKCPPVSPKMVPRRLFYGEHVDRSRSNMYIKRLSNGP